MQVVPFTKHSRLWIIGTDAFSIQELDSKKWSSNTIQTFVQKLISRSVQPSTSEFRSFEFCWSPCFLWFRGKCNFLGECFVVQNILLSFVRILFFSYGDESQLATHCKGIITRIFFFLHHKNRKLLGTIALSVCFITKQSVLKNASCQGLLLTLGLMIEKSRFKYSR